MNLQLLTLMVLHCCVINCFYQDYTDQYYVGCYSSHSYDWDEYEQYCIDALSSHLASIPDESSQSDLNGLISSNGLENEHIPIGAHDKDVEDVFEWIDGTPWNYTNWNSGEPNDYSTGEDCSELWDTSGGYWNDVSCSTSRECFICNNPYYTHNNGDGNRIYNISIQTGDQSSDGKYFVSYYVLCLFFPISLHHF